MCECECVCGFVSVSPETPTCSLLRVKPHSCFCLIFLSLSLMIAVHSSGVDLDCILTSLRSLRDCDWLRAAADLLRVHRRMGSGMDAPATVTLDPGQDQTEADGGYSDGLCPPTQAWAATDKRRALRPAGSPPLALSSSGFPKAVADRPSRKRSSVSLRPTPTATVTCTPLPPRDSRKRPCSRPATIVLAGAQRSGSPLSAIGQDVLLPSPPHLPRSTGGHDQVAPTKVGVQVTPRIGVHTRAQWLRSLAEDVAQTCDSGQCLPTVQATEPVTPMMVPVQTTEPVLTEQPTMQATAPVGTTQEDVRGPGPRSGRDKHARSTRHSPHQPTSRPRSFGTRLRVAAATEASVPLPRESLDVNASVMASSHTPAVACGDAPELCSDPLLPSTPSPRDSPAAILCEPVSAIMVGQVPVARARRRAARLASRAWEGRYSPDVLAFLCKD